MGQAIRGLPETPPLGAAPPPGRPEPLGRWLGRERRLRGLTLDEVAAATRIPRRSLERLEAGAFDSQPDGFTRGFVRTVADAIGLDASEALARLLGEALPVRGGRGRRSGLGIVVATGLALLAAGAVSLHLWGSAADEAPPVAPPPPDALLRRPDFVRELAKSPPEIRRHEPLPPVVELPLREEHALEEPPPPLVSAPADPAF